MILLYNKDISIVLSEIKDNTIDLILIDPPYIISRKSGFTKASKTNVDGRKKYGKHTIDFGDWDKKELDLVNLFKQFYRILKPHGTLLMFYDIWKLQEVKLIADKLKFKQARINVWIKTNPVPINSKINYLSNAKEYFVTFVKKSKPTFNSSYNKGVFEYPICHGKERTIHPTQKPLKLIKELIEIHTNENDIVFDGYIGSGTTGLACKDLNRNFIGTELNKEYFNIAKKRLGEVSKT